VNADPTETADQLAQLFPDSTTGSSSSSSQGSTTPFYFRSFGSRSGGSSSASASSDRTKKMGRVLAVPDPRSSSIIVMASKTLMPQIADMIAELDANKGRKEVVGFYDLQNADVGDVQNALQDLFNRNTRTTANNNQSPLLGPNSVLNKRIQQSQQNTTSGTGTGFGASAGRSSLGVGGGASGF
jgi:hypothetical protein